MGHKIGLKMKITPLEIRQKDFEKKLRGYDKDEVQAFLQSLSNEWERVLDDSKELKIKLQQSEKEVQKLREVESSLFKTLKTAEDTGANLVDQANKAAELHMREIQIKAEALLTESKNKSRAIIEQAEQEAKEIINEVQEGVKELDQNYKTIENHRDNLIKELMTIASDIVERVERTDRKKGDFKLQDQIKRVRDLARKSEKKIDSEHLDVDVQPIEPISVEKIQNEVAEEKAREVRNLGNEQPAVINEHVPKVDETIKAPDPSKPTTSDPKKEEKPAKKAEEASFFDLLDDDD